MQYPELHDDIVKSFQYKDDDSGKYVFYGEEYPKALNTICESVAGCLKKRDWIIGPHEVEGLPEHCMAGLITACNKEGYKKPAHAKAS